MGDYNTAAISGINSYLWSNIQSELGWETVRGLVPIISPQQEPELKNTKKPFIVFTWSFSNQDVYIERYTEKAGYLIYSEDVRDVVRGMNLIIDLFRRFNLSAEDVNDYIYSSGTDWQKEYEYKCIEVMTASGPEPIDSEGGTYEASVTIDYTYTVALKDNGRRNFDL